MLAFIPLLNLIGLWVFAFSRWGSSRAESAVEPTRSQNITVMWCRSAWSRAAGSTAVCGLLAGAHCNSGMLWRGYISIKLRSDHGAERGFE